MSELRPGETKYTPLLRQLQALAADQDTVTLALTEVEAVIGAALPPSARTPGFWSGGGSVLLQFQRAGWRAALDRQRDTVTFTRSQP